MALVEFHIVLVVNIDMFTALCIVFWFLICYFSKKILIVENTKSSGSSDDEFESRSESLEEDSNYHSVDEQTLEEIQALIVEY